MLLTARIILLVTSPRLPAGLLTAAAWDVVRAHPVFTAAESEQADGLRAAGVPVTVVEPDRAEPARRARRRTARAGLAGRSGR